MKRCFDFLLSFIATVVFSPLLLILAVVLLVFGVGRISKVGSELGKGISAFREGVKEGHEESQDEDSEEVTTEE